MASNQQIISDLRLIMETDHSVDLLNLFKGVPFICKAKIHSIDGDVVQVKTPDPAIVCVRNEKQTRVLGSDYFEPTMAQVQSVDIAAGLVTLSNFSYLGTKLGERMIVRVEPKDTIEVVLDNEGYKSKGHLADLSISGLGARLGSAEYTAMLKPGTSLKVTIHFPTGPITLPGTVLSAAKTGEYYRLSIRFGQNGPEKRTIFHYLIDRRGEIENELRAAYQVAQSQAPS